jgi:hypothetical protein
LHQTGSIERIATVFALTGTREQFVCRKPLSNDLCAQHCSSDLDWNVMFVIDRQAAEDATRG